MRRRKIGRPKGKRTKKSKLDIKWKSLIIYLDSLYDNFSEIYLTREELIKHFLSQGFSKTSLDTYRNYLTQAGYMVRVGFGIYRLTKRVEIELTLKECKEKAYSWNKKENNDDSRVD